MQCTSKYSTHGGKVSHGHGPLATEASLVKLTRQPCGRALHPLKSQPFSFQRNFVFINYSIIQGGEGGEEGGEGRALENWGPFMSFMVRVGWNFEALFE